MYGIKKFLSIYISCMFIKVKYYLFKNPCFSFIIKFELLKQYYNRMIYYYYYFIFASKER